MSNKMILRRKEKRKKASTQANEQQKKIEEGRIQKRESQAGDEGDDGELAPANERRGCN